MRHALKALCVALPLALAFLIAAPAEAVDFGVRAGLYTDQSDGFVGGELLFPLSPRWYFNPNVEWVFVDNGDLFTVNGDFHYDFNVDFDGFVWAGAGAALIVEDHDPPRRRDRGDGDDAETDVGLNLLGGVGWDVEGFTPYVQGKVIVSDDSEAVVAVGLRF